MRHTMLALLGLFGLLSACRVVGFKRTDADAGPVSMLEVQRVITRNYAAIRSACYDEALRRKPGLKGTVAVLLVIDKNGIVTKAEALGSDDPLGGYMPDPDVTACVLRRVKELSFPGGPVVMNFPFILEPRDDDEGVAGGAK